MFERFNGDDIIGADYAARRKHSFVVPDRLMDNEKVDAVGVAVYMALSRWSDALGYVRVSYDRVADHFQNLDELDREGVARAVGVLEREELVVVHEREDGEGLYSLPDLRALNELNEVDEGER